MRVLLRVLTVCREDTVQRPAGVSQDLASLLDGEQGLFLCQNRGQNYLTVAKAGHSIAFGPTPIGKAIQEQVVASVGPEPWFVTKISHSTEYADFRGTFPGREGR